MVFKEEEINILREKIQIDQGKDPCQQELSAKMNLIQQVLTAKKEGCQALLQETKQQQVKSQLFRF